MLRQFLDHVPACAQRPDEAFAIIDRELFSFAQAFGFPSAVRVADRILVNSSVVAHGHAAAALVVEGDTQPPLRLSALKKRAQPFADSGLCAIMRPI